MLIKTLAGSLALATAFIAGSVSADSIAQETTQQVQQIRNATVKITYGDTTFLIDPMLAEQGAYPGFEDTYRSELRNPLVGLPMPAEEVIGDADAVIVTHTHLDHWDTAAQELLPQDIPLFAQNAADAELIRAQGFSDVRTLDGDAEFGGVQLHKTGGQHGSDTLYAIPDLAQALGDVMGVVFEAPGQKTTYVVGDTVWRDEVERALERHNPEVIVLNTGAAEMTGFEGDPIIMGKEDTLRTHQAAPDATIIAVHMDAVNHMTLSRDELADYVQEAGIEDNVVIPADGEVISF
ncbi:MBL fold metallo-hydrolase [Halomonas korlensis]|uniref:L-ascorbate metabolism protein UlaG, beta-lactamase superfamily n=1 Tax=Halomonas korlensis TaxID=463301 RepID=A0A1I7IYV9_9GAMM|nr:MBL fold metallo-hydrolase [Halomonas korlensis]SFU78074.1 L-ascorbate metabolism protein UlaG, beta-lactamase superfamily [Halomonas korlensis]